ncbi:MAG TPA: BTAD domain-containing putative transcriptional regulator, partial [Chloroflexota bacterium]|nr:BTAD domain-containing putative transcriptional regulator [Chloroflexota bacterium]
MSNAEPAPDARVTYSQQFRRCNKPDCPTCRPGAPGHGPYWYAYWREGGRQRSRYFGKQPPPAVALATPPEIADPVLRVRTLGGFAVWRGTTAVPAAAWSQRKAALLFKCLISAPGHRLHRDQLLELFWPDADPHRGASQLRQAVFQLRRLLGQEGASQRYLRLDGELVILTPTLDSAPSGDWLDALTFEHAAWAALSGQDAAACRAALALYTGEYLPEDRYEEWVMVRREELLHQHLALLLHLAALREQQGALGEAMRCLRSVLAVDPCHEEAARALMRMQTAAGRHVDAIRTYRQVTGALQRDLDLAPDHATEAQYQHALASRQAAIIQRTNLPTPLTSFLGRDREMAVLAQLLAGATGSPPPPLEPRRLSADRPRLLSVTGAGGCGKTRLAIELGHELRNRYADGLWLVELAALSPESEADPALIAQQTCTVLGLRQEPGQPALASLCAFLGPRQVLLILDNCEHVLSSCVALVASLLRDCPSLQILTTSREALGVLGESVWRLSSLAVPQQPALVDPLPADLARYAAVRLLVERARAVRPGFALTLDNRRAVVEICRRLDGIPLAIELAAARLALLSAEQLASRLGDRFRVLSAGNSAALPRHQTLRAVMEWSYQLLSAAEQTLLRALSVFVGGWTLEAAEWLGAGLELATGGVLDLLARLVSKSLAQLDDSVEAPEDETRYRLLETVRQYAAEHLHAAGEEATVRDRHGRWCADLAEQARSHLEAADQGKWLARLVAEHDNMRAALQWTVRDAGDRALGLRLACALGPFWERHGHYREGRMWLEEALAGHPTVEDTLRGTALTHAANLAY